MTSIAIYLFNVLEERQTFQRWIVHDRHHPTHGDVAQKHFQKSKICFFLEISYLHDEAVDGRNRVSDPVELLNGANFSLQNNFYKVK